MSAAFPNAVAAAPAPTAQADRRHRMRAGFRAMTPVLAAFAPFALVVGTAVASSSDPWSAWVGTWLVYGGAAQVAVLDVVAHGGGWVSAAIVGLLINVRLAAYAAAMAPAWRAEPARHRIAAAVMLTDAPWALARDRSRDDPAYFLGAALALFLAWPAMVTAGAFVGSRVDAGPVADLLLPLTLGAVVAPQLRRRPAAAAIAAALVTAVVTSDMDAGTALLLAAAAGTAAGLAAERAR
ncbi:MAG: AzlC family ABC transporter permease [Nocardioides sp.]